jgi:hypothetical protein
LQHKLWSIIEPAGSFRVKWDLLVLVMLAYICIVGPYTICFGSKGHITDPTELMDQVINLLFVVDIYLNFRTAIHGRASCSLRMPHGPKRGLRSAWQRCWIWLHADRLMHSAQVGIDGVRSVTAGWARYLCSGASPAPGPFRQLTMVLQHASS